MNPDINLVYYAFLENKLQMWKRKDLLCWRSKDMKTYVATKILHILDEEDTMFSEADRIMARYVNIKKKYNEEG